MNFPVFDFHCDTALALLGEGFVPDKQLAQNALHIDLERAKKLPGYCQCFACFTSPWEQLPENLTVTDVFERELNTIVHEISRNYDVIRQAFTAEDVEENYKNGLMSAILTIEGPAGIGFDPELLELMHTVGFRISTLGWNEKNSLIGSHVTGGGLTDLGRKYVKECQRLGILVDVSHCSDEGFWDIMDVTEGPVIASHSNSRSVHNHSRNLTDEMFSAICRTGGVAGLNLYAGFLGQQPDLDTACDHVLHWLELDPEGTHIALGGDMDGCDPLPEGCTGIDSYLSLQDRLLQRGVTEEILENICWNNGIGVMKRAVHNHTKQK